MSNRPEFRALVVTGFVVALIVLSAVLSRYDLVVPDEQREEIAATRPAKEIISMRVYTELIRAEARMVVGTIKSQKVLISAKSARRGFEDGEITLKVDRVIIGSNVQELKLKYSWQWNPGGVPTMESVETPWGNFAEPRAGSKWLVMLKPEGMPLNLDHADSTYMVWPLPEYEILIPAFEAVAKFVTATNDAARLEAFKTLCQFDSDVTHIFAEWAVLKTSQTRDKLNKNDISFIMSTFPDAPYYAGQMMDYPKIDPWNRIGTDTRRAMLVEFMRSVAPKTRDQQGTEGCSPRSINQKLGLILVVNYPETVPADLTDAAASWFWQQLGATGSPRLDQDQHRKGMALLTLDFLADKKGPGWVLSAFETQGTESLRKRIREATVGLKPEVVEIGNRLLEKLNRK